MSRTATNHLCRFWEVQCQARLRYDFWEIFDNCQLKTLLNSEIPLYVTISYRVYRNVAPDVYFILFLYPEASINPIYPSMSLIEAKFLTRKTGIQLDIFILPFPF